MKTDQTGNLLALCCSGEKGADNDVLEPKSCEEKLRRNTNQSYVPKIIRLLILLNKVRDSCMTPSNAQDI